MAQVALVGAALAVVPSTAEAWHPHVHAASAYAQRRAGQVTFAVRTPHRLYGRGVTRVVPSASVLKAMLLVAYLRRDSVRHRAHARRPAPARADDPPLGQRQRRSGAEHRRERRAAAPGAPGRHAALHAGRLAVGPVAHRRRRPDALLPEDRPPDAAPPPAHGPAAAQLDREAAALGHRPRAPARLGAVLQGAAGAPAPVGWTIRSRCCAAAGAGCRSRFSPRTARATPTASRPSEGWPRGSCAASARRACRAR